MNNIPVRQQNDLGSSWNQVNKVVLRKSGGRRIPIKKARMWLEVLNAGRPEDSGFRQYGLRASSTVRAEIKAAITAEHLRD